MCNRVTKSIQMFIFVLLSFCLSPTPSKAAVAVQSEVVSGKIMQIYENHAIRLDNGEVYQPSRDNLIVNRQVGEHVSLRYVIEQDEKNVFFEIAPGTGSLMHQPPATSKSTSTPQ